jgi:hypothetical protein
MFTDMGMQFDFIDFTDVAKIERYIKPNTKMVFSESPANPTLTLTDLAAVSALAKSRNLVRGASIVRAWGRGVYIWASFRALPTPLSPSPTSSPLSPPWPRAATW